MTKCDHAVHQKGAFSGEVDFAGGPQALSESPRCNDMVADLHFPQFFGTAH